MQPAPSRHLPFAGTAIDAANLDRSGLAPAAGKRLRNRLVGEL